MNGNRWIAVCLAIVMAFLSPGTGAYDAFAQTAARVGASASMPRLSLPAAPLGVSLTPAASSLLPSMPSASLTLPSVAQRAVRPAASPLSTPLPQAGQGGVRSSAEAASVAGRQAIAREITAAVDFAAPLAETAAKGSLGQARASGAALEDILTRRASRRDAGLVSSSLGPVVRGALSLKSIAAATALAFAFHASASLAQVPVPTQIPVPQQTEFSLKREEGALAQDTPVAVEVAVTGQGATVGVPMTLTLTVRNLSGAPLAVPSVRASIEEALPNTLEILGQDDGIPLTLASGEAKTLAFSIVPFDAGKIVLEGAELAFPAADPEKPLIIKIPAAAFEVASVLTPGWEERGLGDLAEIRRVELLAPAWLLALPLSGLALVGAKRLLAARRRGRDPLIHNPPALDAARSRLARLEAGAPSMSAREFHGETLLLVERLLCDLRGLPRRERSMSALMAAAKGKYSSGQLAVVTAIVDAALPAVYDSGRGDSPELRRRALVALRELIADLEPAPKARPESSPMAGLAALLGLGGVSVGFAQPWALLLAVPVAAWALRKWSQKKTPAWSAPASSLAPAKATWRARLAWVPSFLRASTVALVLLALAGPQAGVKRSETYVPSTDTIIAADISDSMSGPRLEGLARAVRDYLVEQRRGGQNRVGVVTFSDDAYLAVSLTTDYDALIARVKETRTEGSTAVGNGMLAAISHFLDLNIMRMDAADPDAAEMRKLVLANDLAGALTYAKARPDLLDKVLQPEKTKIVVIFTDGESNSGIDPVEAAKIAKQLGIKVYTVGIQIGAGEAALKEVAAATGGLYFRAEDADGMRDALLDIARLEKSPALVRAQAAVSDLATPLTLLALLSLLLEVGLVSTRFRSLPALMLAGLVGFNGVTAPDEGDALYLQGRFGDAVKRYSTALESHPDVSDLYFNLGNAYLRSGDSERAARAYGRFLELTKDPKAASEALYNLGNAAVLAQDAEKAVEMYREALRKDPTNASAKRNLEIVNLLLAEQGKDQGDGKDRRQKKGKKGRRGNQKSGQDGNQDGDREAEPGDKKGSPGGKPGKDGRSDGAKPTPGEREKGADGVIREQGKTEKEGREVQRGAVPRKGSGVWGFSLAGLGSAAAGFQAPLGLTLGLAAVPVVAALVVWAVNKRIQAARKLAPAEAPKDLKGWYGRGLFWTKFSMLLAATLSLALAAGDPILGSKDTRLDFGGKDVLVTSDVSASTLFAEDGRGARAQKELSEFVAKMQGTDRIGLVVFSGRPRTASPLSQDYGTFDFKVSRLEREARGLSGGSDLAAAVAHSIKVFEGAKKVGERQRILIVVSDGDIFDQDLAKAVAAARTAGVTIFTIGVGDPAGSRIALPKADGPGTEFLIDEKSGQPALSKLYEGPLRKLASETGGAYFRSSDKVSMSDILGKVAEMSKGEETDSIKTPRGISYVFLTPALLLLILEAFLPGAPLLRGRRPRPQTETTALHGAAWIGLVSITLSVWPAILPFAAAAAILSGLILYDLSTQGALGRGVLGFIERKAPAEGLERDLFALFDGPTEGRDRWRDADHEAVKALVRALKGASPEARAALIEKAGEDAELWREKLTAAWLAESAWPTKKSDETRQAVLAAMAKAVRLSTRSLPAVLERVLARRAELAWLGHPSVQRPLDALSAEFLDAPRPSVRPAPPGRLAKYAAITVVIATVALTGFAGYKTVEFSKASREAAQTALSIFYGDDFYVLSDAYNDERIARDVLPVLKEWHAAGRAPAAALAKALEVLRTSPDPKADNILETVFKRADHLPLTDASETLMLRTLIERDNDRVWRFLNEYMAQNGEKPASTKRLVKMINLGAEIGSEDVFRNLFHFLKSPDRTVKDEAAKAIRVSLTAPEKSSRFAERLKAVSAGHQADPLINLWVATFALDRLSGADASAVSVTEIDSVLSAALKAAAKADALRPGLIIRVKPGEEGALPLPVLAQAMGIMDESLDRAARQGVDIEPLALAVRRQVDEAVKALVVEGVETFPDLKARLIKNGVLESDDTTKARLAAFAAAVRDEAAKAGAAAKPEQREFADRALKVLAAAGPVADKSGAPQGGTAGEAAAAEVNAVLSAAYGKLPGATLLSELRAAGLAPNANVPNEAARSYRRSYSAEEALRVRALLAGILARGAKDDSIGWANKRFLLASLDRVDALVSKHYPAAAKSIPADRSAGPLAAFAKAAGAKDPAAVAKALDRLKAAYGAAPDKDAVMARFQELYAPKAASSNDALRLQVLRFWAERLAQDGARLDKAGARQVLELVAPRHFAPKAAPSGYDAVAAALKSARASGADAAVLTGFARSELSKGTARVLGGAQEALSAKGYESLRAALAESRLLLGAEDPRPVRKEVSPHHLRSLAAALAGAFAAEKGAGTGEAAAWTAPTVRKLQELAAAAGLPDGGSPAERAADAVNERLGRASGSHPASGWYAVLRAAGLAPAGTSADWETALARSYSAAELRGLHSFLTKSLASGRGWDHDGKPSALSAGQARFLADAADGAAAAMTKFYPGEPALSPAGLGTMVEKAARGDAAARVAASARLAQASSAAEALALLQAAADRVQTPEGEKILTELLLEGVGSPTHGAALADMEEAAGLLFKMGEARRGTGSPEVWDRLAAAAAGGTPSQKAFILKAANALLAMMADAVKDAEGAEDLLVSGGVLRKTSDSVEARGAYSKRHVAAFQEAVGALLKSAKVPDVDKRALALVSRLLPPLLRAADLAGMPAGDEPAAVAAERVASLVAAGHQLFPGSRFIDEIRSAKALPPVAGAAGFDADRDVPPAMTRDQVRALRDFVLEVLKSGQGYDDRTGRRPLTDGEREYLEAAVQALDALISAYGPAAGPAVPKVLHGFAPAALVPLGGSVSGLLAPLLALVAAAAVVWAFVRWFKAARRLTDDGAGASRLALPEAVLDRYKKLDLAARKTASSLTEGKFRSRLIGAGGLTFAELANYQGEDVRAINWKASGKGDQLMVNRYELEKDMPLLLLVDLSASGEFAAAGVEKRRVIEDAAALLALTAARRDIRVGALFFTDRVEAYVPPAGGERHAWEIVRRALGTVPQGSKTDLRLALDFALGQAKSRAMVVLLSDLVADGWEPSLANVAGRHDFRAVRVVDPAEAKPLPDAGLVLARDPETGAERWIDTSSAEVREHMGAEAKARERRLTAALAAARSSPITLYTDEDAVDALSRTLLKVK